MNTYRYGAWETMWGDKYYSIDKKTFLWGWKEITTYPKTDKGYQSMMRAVESLEKSGNIVL